MIPILLANLADLLTFVCAASVLSIEGEANPLARFIFGAWGFPGVVLYKIAGVSIALLMLSFIDTEGLRIGLTVFLVVVPLVGALANTWAVAR